MFLIGPLFDAFQVNPFVLVQYPNGEYLQKYLVISRTPFRGGNYFLNKQQA